MGSVHSLSKIHFGRYVLRRCQSQGMTVPIIPCKVTLATGYTVNPGLTLLKPQECGETLHLGSWLLFDLILVLN
jgi:hypothetical protein